MTTVVSARIQLHRDSWESYLAAAQIIVPLTRQENGCVHYGFSIDLIEDCVVWISEEWESEEALMAHLQTPHISHFITLAQGMQILDADIKKYTVSVVGGF